MKKSDGSIVYIQESSDEENSCVSLEEEILRFEQKG